MDLPPYPLIRITAANVDETAELLLQPGAFYVMDRAYTDFARLYTFTRSLAFFVVRAKRLLPKGLPPEVAYAAITQSSFNENLPSLSRPRHQLDRYPEALGP